MLLPVRISLLFVIGPVIAWCQKPVISSGGVVNAASYQPGVGIITSIFGQNLAATTQTATTAPLPTQLGGTSVTIGGVAAPLFYVSPTQINFDPSGGGFAAGTGLVVSTAAGASDPYPLSSLGETSPGIYTRDANGCGQGSVLNVTTDGSVLVNSSSDSASPGDYISVFGDLGGGVFYNEPANGYPAPSNPLATLEGGLGAWFDLAQSDGGTGYWVGLAPGEIGVVQMNYHVPTTVREGCAVPLQVSGDGISAPVTISIKNGGGPCSDPPSAGYGQVTWEKTITTGVGSTSEADTVTVSLQASPGRKAPAPPVYGSTDGTLAFDYSGPSCPVPGYRSLGAGTVSVQGPGFGPLVATIQALQGSVSGLSSYQAILPAGSIQPGTFTVSATGGADVSAFQSSVQIGSGIQITTPLAGQAISGDQPLTINWTGGGPNTWVTLLVTDIGITPNVNESFVVQAKASAGTITIPTVPTLPCLGIHPTPCYIYSLPFPTGGPMEVTVRATPDPSQTPSFSAQGLSLGGQQLWQYTYKFSGVSWAQ
jgi:uncharacterized protein (TIGR03437 family)